MEINPRSQEQLQNAAHAAGQNEVDHTRNSCVMNAWNDTLALPANTVDAITTRMVRYQARCNRLSIIQDMTYDALVASGGFTLINSGYEVICRLPTDWTYRDYPISACYVLTAAAGAYVLYHALEIAESYHPRTFPPTSADASASIAADVSASIARALQVINDETEVTTCVVCQDDITPGQGVRLANCIHPHHRDCITQWLMTLFNEERVLTCPICNTNAL